jgi:hypothetical protein
MMEKERKQKIQHQVLLLGIYIFGCLLTGGLSVLRSLSAYHVDEQYNQGLTQLEAKSISVVENKDSYFQVTIESLKGSKINKNKVEEIVPFLLSRRDDLNQDLLIMSISITSALALSVMMFHSIYRLKNLAFSDFVFCYFPEEIVAELVALSEILTNDRKSIWLIRFILFHQILTLAWGIYVQINIDNLTLHSSDRRIDK